MKTAPRIVSIAVNKGASEPYRAVYDIEVTGTIGERASDIQQYIHDKWVQSCNLLNITTETT
jgi:hypothetical protein